MARQTTVQLIDDLDGGPAEVTVRFSWDGVGYEIDLSAANAEQFGAALRPYLDAARRPGPTRREPRMAGRAGARAGRARGELVAIRSWARANGMAVADRGRIPADVVDAYRANHAANPTLTPALTATNEGDPASVPAAQATAAKTSAAKKSPAKKTVAKASTTTRSAPAKKAPAKAAQKSAAESAVPASRGRAAKSNAGASGRARKSTGRNESTGRAARRTH